MPYRVRHILLASSLYDSFILTEDGQLNDALLRQYVDLQVRQEPDLTRVSSGAAVLDALARRLPFELIITSLHLGDMDAVELARAVRAAGSDVPVMLLAYDNRELTDFVARNDVSILDRTFLWQGDTRLLLAMVKDLEDRRNVANDTGLHGVPVILVLEDNVRFYSSFLPMLYVEMVKQARSVVAEGLNLSQKQLRARARPKILLCHSFEEAWSYFQAYQDHVLGVISDIECPREGRVDAGAGVELTARIRALCPDIPIVLQSAFPGGEALTDHLGVSFLLKGSPLLLGHLRRVLLDEFGFGDFVFRTPDGAEVGRASTLRELLEMVRTVPGESIAHHGARNHFSAWLRARAELRLAEELRPRRLEDFADFEHLRSDLVSSILRYQHDRAGVVVADFRPADYDAVAGISRIGGGSLGGKARGLAFVNRLLGESDVRERFPGVRISVPTSVVLGTDVFDHFLEQGGLKDFAVGADSDEAVERRFQSASLSADVVADLEVFLRHARHPLAVRSSGLLEDSPQQPFAGIYQTWMLPNDEPDPDVRLRRLIDAIRRVYASTFSQAAKAFLPATPYRLEEEKMAVIIQRVVGRRHGDRYYPDFAGVARSHNFYPFPPVTAEDGVAAVALGLGQAVTEGRPCLRFSPRHPRHPIGFATTEDLLADSQREFFALDLGVEARESLELRAHGLAVAEQDGTLAAVASTYCAEDDVLSDGLSRDGVRLVTFAPLLKHGVFPLAELLDVLLRAGAEGTGSEVEIEFAVNLPRAEGEAPEFGFLQLRPIILSRELEELEVGHVEPEQVLCRSDRVLGNGRLSDIVDVVVVPAKGFDRSRSLEAAQDVARFNARLQAEGRSYVLVGVGRWGSADPLLGIPVTWSQIAGSRVIVEAGFGDRRVAPSQGTHFFQNLTSCNVGYFTIAPGASHDSLDWDWLAAQPAVEETRFVRHLRLPAPLLVTMNGKTGEGVILKPQG